MNQPIEKKSLKIEVKKDSFSIHTDSSNNDLMMMSLLAVMLLASLGIVVMYKLNKGRQKDV